MAAVLQKCTVTSSLVLGLVQSVHEYMEDVLWKLTEGVATAFPRLQTAITALVQALQIA